MMLLWHGRDSGEEEEEEGEGRRRGNQVLMKE
jgi:hypothetical protein